MVFYLLYLYSEELYCSIINALSGYSLFNFYLVINQNYYYLLTLTFSVLVILLIIESSYYIDSLLHLTTIGKPLITSLVGFIGLVACI